MTMLNGEPVDTPNISTAHPAAPTASSQSQSVGFLIGLMALIFAFAIPLAGAVLGGIAVAQARAGGYRNPAGMAGLVLGVVFTMLITAAVVVFIVLGTDVFTDLLGICQQLGPGTHQQNGVTYTCG